MCTSMKATLLPITALLVLLVTAAQAAPVPPYITVDGTANAYTLTVPTGQTQGTTTIVWDGGSFTRTKLWLSVDGAAETLFAGTFKGAQQITVMVGKSYVFKLWNAERTALRAALSVTASTAVKPPTPPGGGGASRAGPATSSSAAPTTRPALPRNICCPSTTCG